jgi:hypothetical protein
MKKIILLFTLFDMGFVPQTTYDRILAIRIALQKPLISTNQLVEVSAILVLECIICFSDELMNDLPQMKHQREKDADTNDDNEREQARIAVQNLLDISSKLGTLRSVRHEIPPSYQLTQLLKYVRRAYFDRN